MVALKYSRWGLAKWGATLWLGCGGAWETEAKPAPLVLWHAQDRSQARFLEKVVREVDPAIRLESGVELAPALVTQSQRGLAPAAAIVPADSLSLAAELRLSEIPADLKSPEVPAEHFERATLGGKLHGLPLLDGNHPLLFFNRRWIASAPASWDALREQVRKLPKGGPKGVGWHRTPYFFAPFWRAFGGRPFDDDPGDTAILEKTLAFFASLESDRIVEAKCGFACATDDFLAGRYAFAINGDWALRDAFDRLGEGLGVAAIPNVESGPVHAYRLAHVLVFPNDSLRGPHRGRLLALARHLQSLPVQTRWQNEAFRRPVNAKVPAPSVEVLRTSFAVAAVAPPIRVDARTLFRWGAIGRGTKSSAAPAQAARAIREAYVPPTKPTPVPSTAPEKR